MSRDYDEKEMNKNKRGLLIRMVQRRFENHIYEHLGKADFANMESLDLWLDKMLTEYFIECDAITAYYDNR